MHVLKNEFLICHRFVERPLTVHFRTHAHDKWEYLFIVKGNPICMIEGKRYAIEEKTLLVFKPAQIHHVQTSGSQPYEYFSLMCEDAPHSLTIEPITDSTGFFVFENADAVYHSFQEFNRQSESMELTFSSADKITATNAFLKSVLGDARKYTQPTLLSEDPIIRSAVSYIENNVHGITRLDQICDAVGVTKEKLYGLFIRNMLISPMKYVRAKKAALAKMVHSDAEVCEAASEARRE